jgi:hypothetical protein
LAKSAIASSWLGDVPALGPRSSGETKKPVIPMPPASFLAARDPHQHAHDGLAAENAEAVIGLELIVALKY